MSRAITDQEFWPELQKLLDLPDEIVELTLHCKVNEVVTLELVTNAIPLRIEDKEVVKEIKRYHLTEIREPTTITLGGGNPSNEDIDKLIDSINERVNNEPRRYL
jgi:hypothetical protein